MEPQNENQEIVGDQDTTEPKSEEKQDSNTNEEESR